MPEEIEWPLAKTLYEAHAESHKLQTKWNTLPSHERRHWVFIAQKALAFMVDMELAGVLEE